MADFRSFLILESNGGGASSVDCHRKLRKVWQRKQSRLRNDESIESVPRMLIVFDEDGPLSQLVDYPG